MEACNKQNLAKYSAPVVLHLGSPAEICQVTKVQPPADGLNLTFGSPFPGESTPPTS
jgi:hypothetical protein